MNRILGFAEAVRQATANRDHDYSAYMDLPTPERRPIYSDAWSCPHCGLESDGVAPVDAEHYEIECNKCEEIYSISRYPNGDVEVESIAPAMAVAA